MKHLNYITSECSSQAPCSPPKGTPMQFTISFSTADMFDEQTAAILDDWLLGRIDRQEAQRRLGECEGLEESTPLGLTRTFDSLCAIVMEAPRVRNVCLSTVPFWHEPPH